mgnify:CR=1 FL=1
MRLYGVVGWKNAGKTGLMERLVSEITGRGISVSTVKHAHHSFDVDHPGKDSHRHRVAGATEVLLASHNRFLVQQLDLVHRSMALMATTSLAALGRPEDALKEHDAIVSAIEARDPAAAGDALKAHISKAFVTRLKLDSGEVDTLV